MWKRQSPPYQVSIIGYQSDKKYHGVKKFTSYEIQAEVSATKLYLCRFGDDVLLLI